MRTTRRRLTRREVAYFSLRGAAAVGVVSSMTVLPHGLPAALLCVVCGVVALLTCVGVNAGGPGEQSGSAPFARAYERVRPPQGEWPPYDSGRVVEGTLAD